MFSHAQNVSNSLPPSTDTLQTDADDRLTPATLVVVSNDLHGTDMSQAKLRYYAITVNIYKN